MKKNIGIGLITPSAPLPAIFPDRFNRGKEYLEKKGFCIKCGHYTSDLSAASSENAYKRAQDINDFYKDSNIDYIMATIGGNNAVEVLPYIDYESMKATNKPLIGYSDITALLHAVGKLGRQVVFYGPTLLTEFAEYPVAPSFSIDMFLKAINKNDVMNISPSPYLLEKGSDWALPPRERKIKIPVIQKTIRGGKSSGVVLGGCMQVLQRLRGTNYWPSFKDSILIIETVTDEFIEQEWRDFVADYKNMGILDEIKGLIIGQKLWGSEEVQKLSEILLSATEKQQTPILYGLPFGHVSPIATIPMYTSAEFDSDEKLLTYLKPYTYDYCE